MKKPIKTTKAVKQKFDIRQYSDDIDSVEYPYPDMGLDFLISVSSLQNMLNDMEKNGATHLALECTWDYSSNVILRVETPEEVDTRFKKEMWEYQQHQKSIKDKQKLKIIEEAKKLGLKVSE